MTTLAINLTPNRNNYPLQDKPSAIKIAHRQLKLWRKEWGLSGEIRHGCSTLWCFVVNSKQNRVALFFRPLSLLTFL